MCSNVYVPKRDGDWCVCASAVCIYWEKDISAVFNVCFQHCIGHVECYSIPPEIKKLKSKSHHWKVSIAPAQV